MRHAWRFVGLVLVGGFGVVFVVGNRSGLPDAWREIRMADGRWLLVAVAFSLVGQAAIGLLHAAAQRAVGLHLEARRAVPLGVAAHFLNLVTKSGGMAGMVVFVADARRRERPRGPTIAAYVLASVLADVGFAVTLAVGMVVVAVNGRLSGPEVGASVAFAVLFVVRVATVVTAVRSRSGLRRLYGLPRRLLNRVLRRRRDGPVDLTAADELYEAIQVLRRRPAAALPAAVLALGMEAAGIGMLWAVLGAVHSPHDLALAIVAYAISVLFTIVGFLPGGLGVVEVSLGAVLVSFGSPVGEAAAAVALYRLVELWLPALVGAAVFRRLRRAGRLP